MSQSAAEIADSIRKRYAGELERVRRDTSRTAEWRRQELARIYRRMTAERDATLERQEQDQARQRRRLEDQVFGLGSLTGDPASLAISRRDAGDRAAQLKTNDQAAALLARANRSGDEPLARAIAERAFEMGWADVGNAFLETRPRLEQAYTDLWNSERPTLANRLMSQMASDLRPTELHGLTEYAIERLAAEDGQTAQQFSGVTS